MPEFPQAPPPPRPEPAPGGGTRPGGRNLGDWVRRGSDNLDLLKALFLGVVSTAVIYEVFPLPFVDDRRVLLVFDNWISEVIVGLTAWSLFILAFKYRQHRRQAAAHQAFSDPRVGEVLQEGITSRNVDTILERLRGQLEGLRVKRFEESAIFRRVLRILFYVRSVPEKEGVNELLDYQAQIDVKKLDASYTVLQVFIWAIPILGFIGTVMGIAESVREFSGFIQSAEGGGEFNTQLRAALGGVTSGLAVAFNTTFLALVLVVPVMLATSVLQKSEEELLLSIEEYCLEELLPQLHFARAQDATQETFDEHLQRIQQLSSTWLGQFEPLLRSLSVQVDMVRHQMSGIQPLIKDFTDRLLGGEPTGAERGGDAGAERPGPAGDRESAAGADERP